MYEMKEEQECIYCKSKNIRILSTGEKLCQKRGCLRLSYPQIIESKDLILIDFISKQISIGWRKVNYLTKIFKNFINYNKNPQSWLNDYWMGLSLKRLNLIKKKRRMSKGVEVILDIEKAKVKIKMFKEVEPEIKQEKIEDAGEPAKTL